MYRITLPEKTKQGEDGKKVSAYLGTTFRRAGVAFMDGVATVEDMEFHALFHFGRIGATVEKKSGNSWKAVDMTRELAERNPKIETKKSTAKKTDEEK